MKNRITTSIRFWFSVSVSVLVITAVSAVYQPLNAEDKNVYKSLKLFTDVLEEIEANYVDEVDVQELIQSAVKGMVADLDPHSVFMPPEAFDELQDDTKGAFGGIGIVITIKEGVLTVIAPIEGTPAYKAGIEAGDVIIKIDGESTRDMALWESVKRMRGPRGEEVEITIFRKGEPDPLEYTLKRDIIPMESVRSTIVKPGYGYVWITNFRDNTCEDLKQALDSFEKNEKPLKGLILDLRNNPGGLLEQAVDISDLFLDQGTIVSIKGRLPQHTEVFNAHENKGKRDYPIVVLINGGSASASEIVAGALQDHKRAVILGTTSFGKGSVQSVKPLKQGFGLKYTIARYYTPSGRSIQAEGIKPDIEVAYKIIEEEKKEKKESFFDRMISEKDLKNHLESEKEKKEKKEKKDHGDVSPHGLLSLDKLHHDYQVKRALDILVGYGILQR
ncbi:MAG: S41 family peptidase [Desulfobacteraceae bacterium]